MKLHHPVLLLALVGTGALAFAQTAKTGTPTGAMHSCCAAPAAAPVDQPAAAEPASPGMACPMMVSEKRASTTGPSTQPVASTQPAEAAEHAAHRHQH